MAGRKGRSREQIALDRTKVARAYLEGKPQAAIAAELGLSPQQISYDLGKLRDEWLASALRDFDAARAQELAKVDALEAEYWAAWRKSQASRVSTSTRRTSRGETALAEASRREESREGNPAYLAGVQWCINRRCELLGLDAPKRSEVTHRDEMAGKTDAELDDIIAEGAEGAGGAGGAGEAGPAVP